VYALGAILYELLTGTPPFQGANPVDSLRRILSQEPVAPSRLAPSLPRDLEAICLKCLEKEPARRYESALALAEDLHCYRTGQPVKARHSGPLRRAWKWARRHPQRVAWAAAAVVLALIPVVVLFNHFWTQRALRLRAEAQAPLVRQILKRHCHECHGQNPKKVQKNLHILDYQNLLDSDRRIVVPGSPDDSRLMKRIADGSMPPEEQELRLPRVSEKELVILRDWILGGAPPFPSADTEATTAVVSPSSALAAQVKTIFVARCYKCHNYKDAKGGIKILHHRLLISVNRVVVPGHPEDSELFQLISSSDEDNRMPKPPAARLSRAEIATVRDWILEGALPFPRSD
jgi:mono/diheme cytochrome c family protein